MHFIILFLVLGFVLGGAWDFIAQIKLRGVLLIASVVLAYVGIFQLVDHGASWAVWLVTIILLLAFIGLIGYSVYLLIKHFSHVKKTIW